MASMANVSNFTTYISYNNHLWIIIPTLIDLNYNEYNQGLRYYPFMVNLDRCNGSCNTLANPSGRICAPKQNM